MGNRLDSYARREFTMKQLRENSSNSFFGSLHRFCIEGEEYKPEFWSVEQAFQMSRACTAYGLWEKERRREKDFQKQLKISDIMGSILSIAQDIYLGIDEGLDYSGRIRYSPQMQGDRFRELGDSVPFPPSPRHPEGNTAYWDRLAPDILKDLVRTSFIANPDLREELLLMNTPGHDENLYLKVLFEVREDFLQQKDLETRSEEAGIPVYGENDITVKFEQYDNPTSELTRQTDMIVRLLVDGGMKRPFPNLIDVHLDWWNYPKYDGVREVGIDWEGMAHQKATDVLNGFLQRGRSTRNVDLEIFGVLKPSDDISDKDLELFVRTFMGSLADDGRQYRSVGSGKYVRSVYSVHEDSYLDIRRIMADGSSNTCEAVVRAAQELGLDVTVFANKQWSYIDEYNDTIRGEKNFKKRFPPVPILEKYRPRREEFLKTVSQRVKVMGERRFNTFAKYKESSGNYYTALQECIDGSDVALLLFADRGSLMMGDLQKAAGDKGVTIAVNASPALMAARIASFMEHNGFPKHGINLTIAGDRLTSFRKMPQEDLNDIVLNVLWTLENDHGCTFSSVRTCGGSGIEMAGTISGISLGLPTSIIAPHGWRFNDGKGNVIHGKESFMKRFENVRVLPDAEQFNSKLSADDFVEKGPIDISSLYYRRFYDGATYRPFSLNDILRIAGKGPEDIYYQMRLFMGKSIDAGAERYLGIRQYRYRSPEHAVQALQAYCGVIHANNPKDRSGCLICLDRLHNRTDMSDERIGRIARDIEPFLGAAAQRAFDGIFETVVKDMILVSFLISGEDLQKILDTGDRPFIDGTSKNGQSMMTDILNVVRAEIPSRLKNELEKQERVRERLQRVREEEKMKESGDYALPEGTVRITDEHEGFLDVELAWIRGRALKTDGVTVDSSSGSLANARYMDSEDRRYYSEHTDQWEFQPNRFYVTRRDDGSFTIEAARFIGEYGFGEYTDFENREVRNGDCIRVQGQDVDKVSDVFNSVQAGVNEVQYKNVII